MRLYDVKFVMSDGIYTNKSSLHGKCCRAGTSQNMHVVLDKGSYPASYLQNLLVLSSTQVLWLLTKHAHDPGSNYS